MCQATHNRRRGPARATGRDMGRWDGTGRRGRPVDFAAMVDVAAWTRSPVLEGERVRLEPLDARHVPGLLEAAADPATWTWLLTWLAPATWGTGINVEAKLLLLTHAFDELGAMRVELKTDARNERSQAAILALGAQFEGVFRKHMRMPDGRIRDSAWYAITDDDWPAVRTRLEARLAASR